MKVARPVRERGPGKWTRSNPGTTPGVDAHTFHAGWSVRQLPDGTVITTTPTGHSYTTKPGITLLFPHWNISTPAPPPKPVPPPSEHRGLAMPKRKQTRVQAKTARIKAERAKNAADGEPPPF